MLQMTSFMCHPMGEDVLMEELWSLVMLHCHCVVLKAELRLMTGGLWPCPGGSMFCNAVNHTLLPLYANCKTC